MSVKEGDKQSYKKVHIRKTHPGLYKHIMIAGIGNISLALNLWFFPPAFMPYGVNRFPVGILFFVLGVSLVVFLNIHRDLRKIRLALTISCWFSVGWAVSNTYQFFTANASLQLPIYIIIVAAHQVVAAIESPVNPMTERL